MVRGTPGRRWGVVRVSAWVGLAGACTAEAPPPPPPPSIVIVGVQAADSVNGAIDSVRIVTTLGGATQTDETVQATALPHEVRLVAPAANAAAAVAVRVDGFQSAVGTAPLLERTAETTFVPDQTKLLRVVLEGPCLLGLPGGPPGGPTCFAPTTCIHGDCVDDHVSPDDLEAYATNWPANEPDLCKPPNAGPPIIQVGTGQTDYLPLINGQTIAAEVGPQGGHHVWIAVRQQNLKMAGSTTTITSVQPDTGLVGPKASFVFTFNQDEGGFCKLAGLRYQLDIAGADYHLFLGQPLDVTVSVTDVAGATGSGKAHMNIAPALLCPSGASDGGC